MSTAVQPEVCHHCHGTGYEPVMPTDADREALLGQLQEAGARRAQHSSSRKLAGRERLNAAYADIRVLAAEAERLGLTRVQVAEAVGVKRANLYLILSGKVGD